MTNRKPSPLNSLMQDLQDLGLTSSPDTGQEHVLRENSHHDGGRVGLRARIGTEQVYVYTWKPNVKVQTVALSREEALKLATLIHKQWPLDALGEA